MKMIYILLAIIVLALLVIFFTPVGFRLGLWGPRNYNDCVAAGGQTNENQMRFGDACYYEGKWFGGGNI